MRTQPGPPRRSLRQVDLLAIGLNATVGSGIFLLPDDLFRQMGPWSPLAFLLCAIGLLPVAWCFSDAARRTTLSGGPYEYARQEFGETAGFFVGFMCFANAVFSFAAVAAAAAAYAARLLPVLDAHGYRLLCAALTIGAFGALNYSGARPGATAIVLFTLGKFSVLFLLVGVLLPEWQFERWHSDLSLPATAPAAPESSGVAPSGVASAVFMALFALQGFEVVGVPAGEAKDPERKVPRAVLGTLVAAGALYLVVQCVLVFGYSGLGTVSDAPLADAALTLNPALGTAVAIGALVSTLGFVSGSALGTPRYLYAMAARGQLPAAFARLHAAFQTPHIAIIATCAVAVLLVLPLDYRTLIGMSNVAVAVQYCSTCAAVLRHHATNARDALSYRGAGIAALGLLSSLTIWFGATWQEFAFALAFLVAGALLRQFLRKKGPPSDGELPREMKTRGGL